MINQPTLRMIQRRKELLGRRGLKKTASAIVYPKMIEKKYQAELVEFVNVLSREINTRLVESLEQIEKQKNIELNLDSWVDSIDEVMNALKIWGAKKASEMLAIVTLKASQINDWNSKQFKQSIKTVIGVDPISKNQNYQTLIESWAKENARLITSIQSTLLDDVAGVTQRGMSSGKSINDISKEIKDRFGVSKSRARLIARSEVGKLNGNLSKYRNEELGIKTYTWFTSLDERVRDSHKSLSGMLCKWGDDSVYSSDGGKTWQKRTGKMFRGKPGDDFQCRCSSRSGVGQLMEELGLNEPTQPTPKAERTEPIIKPIIEAPMEKEPEIKVPKISFGYDGKFDKYVEDIRPEAKIVIDKLPKPSISENRGLSPKSAYLTNFKTVVFLNKEKDTFIHEYGHHIDNILGFKVKVKVENNIFVERNRGVSASELFIEARKKDIEHLKDKFKEKNMFKELSNKWKNKKEFEGASDIFDSLSYGIFFDKYQMPGHGSNYYKKKKEKYKGDNINNQQAEVFANLFEAYSNGGKKWDNILEYYPNQAKVFEDTIKKAINE